MMLAASEARAMELLALREHVRLVKAWRDNASEGSPVRAIADAELAQLAEVVAEKETS